MGENSGIVGSKPYTYSRETQVQGSKKQRLRFYDKPADIDSYVEIAAKNQLTARKDITGLFKNIYERLRYVKINSPDGVSMYINISSAAKKTGLQPKEIKSLAKDAGSDRIKVLAEPFVNILDQATVKIDEKTAEKISNLASATKLSKETITAAYQIGISLLLHHTQPSSGEGVSLKAKEHTFVFNHSPEGPEMRLKMDQIGKGATGEVNDIKEVISYSDASYVIKTGITTEDEKSIRKEYDLLKFVNEGGPHPGIQRGARAMFTDLDGNVAILNDKYNGGDAAAAIKAGGLLHGQKIETQLKQALNLFQGLVHLEKKGVCLIDIKPENMFVEKRNEEIFICLADFGSAKKMEDIQKNAKEGQKFSPGHFTHAYSSESHFISAQQGYNKAVKEYAQKNIENGDRAFEECKKSLHQMALFAVALSVAEIMKIPLNKEENPLGALEKASIHKDEWSKQMQENPILNSVAEVLDRIFEGSITSPTVALNELKPLLQ